MTTTYEPGPAGWVRVNGSGTAFFVRFKDDDGRLVPAQLVLSGLVTSDRLRRLYLGRVEAWANGPSAAELRARMDDPGPDPPADLDQAIPQGREKQAETFTIPALDVPPHPGRRGRADDFYRQVAAIYTDAATRGFAPGLAIRIAAAGGLPVCTVGEDEAAALDRVLTTPASSVNSWVSVARRRGFLPPGRAGKVG